MEEVPWARILGRSTSFAPSREDPFPMEISLLTFLVPRADGETQAQPACKMAKEGQSPRAGGFYCWGILIASFSAPRRDGRNRGECDSQYFIFHLRNYHRFLCN